MFLLSCSWKFLFSACSSFEALSPFHIFQKSLIIHQVYHVHHVHHGLQGHQCCLSCSALSSSIIVLLMYSCLFSHHVFLFLEFVKISMIRFTSVHVHNFHFRHVHHIHHCHMFITFIILSFSISLNFHFLHRHHQF